MVKSGEIICVFSDLTEFELENAPQNVKDFFINLERDTTEYVEITEEMKNLAETYLAEKVVGQISFDDCFILLVQQ